MDEDVPSKAFKSDPEAVTLGIHRVPPDTLIEGLPVEVTGEYFEDIVNRLEAIYGGKKVPGSSFTIRDTYARRITTLSADKPVIVKYQYISSMINLRSLINIMVEFETNDLGSGRFDDLAGVHPHLRRAAFDISIGYYQRTVRALLHSYLSKGTPFKELDFSFSYNHGKEYSHLIIRDGVVFDTMRLRDAPRYVDDDERDAWLTDRNPNFDIVISLLGYGSDSAIRGMAKDLEYRMLSAGPRHVDLDPDNLLNRIEEVHGLPNGFFKKVNVPFTIDGSNQPAFYISPHINTTSAYLDYINRIKDIPMLNMPNKPPSTNNSAELARRALNAIARSGYTGGGFTEVITATITARDGLRLYEDDSGVASAVLRIPPEFEDLTRSMDLPIYGPDINGYYYTPRRSYMFLDTFIRYESITRRYPLAHLPIPKWPCTLDQLEKATGSTWQRYIDSIHAFHVTSFEFGNRDVSFLFGKVYRPDGTSSSMDGLHIVEELPEGFDPDSVVTRDFREGSTNTIYPRKNF